MLCAHRLLLCSRLSSFVLHAARPRRLRTETSQLQRLQAKASEWNNCQNNQQLSAGPAIELASQNGAVGGGESTLAMYSPEPAELTQRCDWALVHDRSLSLSLCLSVSLSLCLSVSLSVCLSVPIIGIPLKGPV